MWRWLALVWNQSTLEIIWNLSTWVTIWNLSTWLQYLKSINVLKLFEIIIVGEQFEIYPRNNNLKYFYGANNFWNLSTLCIYQHGNILKSIHVVSIWINSWTVKFEHGNKLKSFLRGDKLEIIYSLYLKWETIWNRTTRVTIIEIYQHGQ